jgi:hypothetical protein
MLTLRRMLTERQHSGADGTVAGNENASNTFAGPDFFNVAKHPAIRC